MEVGVKALVERGHVGQSEAKDHVSIEEAQKVGRCVWARGWVYSQTSSGGGGGGKQQKVSPAKKTCHGGRIRNFGKKKKEVR